MVPFDRISEAHPAAIAGALAATPWPTTTARRSAAAPALRRHLTALALRPARLARRAPGRHRRRRRRPAARPRDQNSWTQTVDEVDPLELLEVQLCNRSRLPADLAAAAGAGRGGARGAVGRAHVVNVSAMEGSSPGATRVAGHPHTNMAKAALNMLTRTSAGEMFETDQILMNAVDTGWITDERPHQEKLRIAAEGWHAPLDLVDGAARVYDPIVRGEAGEDLHGHFLKDYDPAPGDGPRQRTRRWSSSKRRELRNAVAGSGSRRGRGPRGAGLSDAPTARDIPAQVAPPARRAAGRRSATLTRAVRPGVTRRIPAGSSTTRSRSSGLTIVCYRTLERRGRAPR